MSHDILKFVPYQRDSGSPKIYNSSDICIIRENYSGNSFKAVIFFLTNICYFAMFFREEQGVLKCKMCMFCHLCEIIFLLYKALPLFQCGGDIY